MKKPIRIIKSLFLLLLFVSIGCNSNRRNNQGSDMLLEDDSEMEFPNAKYAGNYLFDSGENGTYGRLSIYCKMDLDVSFDLLIGTGAPSYNSGSISGEMEIVNGKGVFKSSEYSNCILEFVFTDDMVSVIHGEGGNECGFDDNLYVNNTFLREPVEISPPQEGKIPDDTLWDIFMKIPKDSVPDHWDFRTKPQRQLAKINQEFKIQYGNSYNHLAYNGFVGEGFDVFMGIAGYLTENEKKIIALFYYGGGVGMTATDSKQTYEYDIASGELKTIECPIDPFTEDEFFDESILTSDQLEELRTSFSSPFGDNLINYSIMDRDGFNVFFEAADSFEEWDDYEKYDDVIREFYERNLVRREWNGKRFVKGEKYLPDFLIKGKSVGRFKIDGQIVNPYLPDIYEEYKFERTERTEMREGTEEKIIEYAFSKDDDTRLVIKPSYDDESDTYTDKTGEIIILSEKHKTKDLIGINSTIEDFIKKYPNYRIWWTYVSNMCVLESETVGNNIQFLLDAEDCIIEPETDFEMTLLDITDFKKDSRIKKIRVLHDKSLRR